VDIDELYTLMTFAVIHQQAVAVITVAARFSNQSMNPFCLCRGCFQDHDFTPFNVKILPRHESVGAVF
jgi:hypothetical protein